MALRHYKDRSADPAPLVASQIEAVVPRSSSNSTVGLLVFRSWSDVSSPKPAPMTCWDWWPSGSPALLQVRFRMQNRFLGTTSQPRFMPARRNVVSPKSTDRKQIVPTVFFSDGWRIGSAQLMSTNAKCQCSLRVAEIRLAASVPGRWDIQTC